MQLEAVTELAHMYRANIEDSAISCLPHTLANMVLRFDELVEEYRTIKEDPYYINRVEEFEKRILVAERAMGALALDYEQYTIPEGFYVAEIGTNFWQRLISREPVNDIRFRAPIPEEARTRYNRAREQRLFSRFVAASPDYENFTRASGLKDLLLRDPVILGYVPENASRQIVFRYREHQLARFMWWQQGQRLDHPGARVDNGVGFLIARWGLAEDRESQA